MSADNTKFKLFGAELGTDFGMSKYYYPLRRLCHYVALPGMKAAAGETKFINRHESCLGHFKVPC